MSVYASVWLCIVSAVPKEARREHQSFGAEVTDGCKLQGLDAGIHT